MTDESLIIVYHYVQRPEERPRMRGLLLEEFEAHVRLLSLRGYRLATLSEYLDATSDFAALPRQKMAVLSFDDGLKQHVDNVAPILEKYGAAGTFFIITRTLCEPPWLAPVHQNHYLLALSVADGAPFSVSDLISEANGWIAKNTGSDAPEQTEELVNRCRAMSPWDTATTAYYKYLVNVYLAEPSRSLAIDHLFRTFCAERRVTTGTFYLSQEDIRTMRGRGMEIGSHSHTHQFLASLAQSEAHDEIASSKALLEDVLGERVASFSYPYGTGGAYTEATMEGVAACNYRAAVTCERGYAALSPSVYAINRIDATDVREYLRS
jgi:peptidoglycan/xylan/chitin deacetylase (PgdA/CDA1 family)